MDRFPILMYHRIVSESCPIPDEDREEARYAVDVETFRWQVGYIADCGARAVSMKMAHGKLAVGEAVPANWIVMTFDDGNLSDYEHARPVLADHGFSATFFVGGDRVGASGGLEPDMLARMASDGFDIGSHGMTHRFLSGLSAVEEQDELSQSKELLENVSGMPVEYYAPPGGRISSRGLSVAKQLSYRAVCTSEFGFNRCDGDRFEFRRIPVVLSTPRTRFRDFVQRNTTKLLSLYMRDKTLRFARRVLGESGYRRFRAVGLGS